MRLSLSAVLAVVALVVQVLVPPGFMLDTSGGQPAITICTGHGPLVLYGRDPAKAPAQQTHQSLCAFAGMAAPPGPPAVAVLPAPTLSEVELIVANPAGDLTPGRGLAAPPPQSHAPPAPQV